MGDSREARLASAIAEYMDCQNSESAVSIESHCERYPDLDPDLRLELKELEGLDCYLQGDRPLGEADELPETLSAYRILDTIGEGGMGIVYLAWDEALQRRVAIKALKSEYCRDRELSDRFMREARVIAKQSHANIATIYRLGFADEAPHYVMEYIDGVTISRYCKAVPLVERIRSFCQLLGAVSHLHQQEIVHRDIKPGNVLVDRLGEVKLLDFGVHAGVTFGELAVIGHTRDYAPPEALGSEQVGASMAEDVYGLGTLLYEVLVGARPFDSGDAEKRRLSRARLPRNFDSSIPAALQHICLKALESYPDKRYSSATKMKEDVERYLAGERPNAEPSIYGELIGKGVDRHLSDLKRWREEGLVDDQETDVIRQAYGRLEDREDAWILQMRRLSWSQVTLYFGLWLSVLAATLTLVYQYSQITGWAAVGLAFGLPALTLIFGLRNWADSNRRLALGQLMTSCLLLPVCLTLIFYELDVFAGSDPSKLSWELFSYLGIGKLVTNEQVWWAVFLSIPMCLYLRLRIGSPSITLVAAVLVAVLGGSTLVTQGLVMWIQEDPGRIFFHLIPWAMVFLAVSFFVERLKFPEDSRYVYPFAAAFSMIAMTGIAAFHEPCQKWLLYVFPASRGQLEYLFLTNAGMLFVLQWICSLLPTAQMRSLGKIYRFFLPGHVLFSLLSLAVSARGLLYTGAEGELLYSVFEARLFDYGLLAAACLFVFGSVFSQLKNYFVMGIVFVGISVFRIQIYEFSDNAVWPLLIVLFGLGSSLVAARYPSILLSLRRLWQRF